MPSAVQKEITMNTKINLSISILLLLFSQLALGSNLLSKLDELHNGLDAYVVNNFDKAIKILLPYAHQGDGVAQYCVARMYDNGWGITKNNNEAIKWYKKAAKQGHQIAKTILKEFKGCQVKKSINCPIDSTNQLSKTFPSSEPDAVTEKQTADSSDEQKADDVSANLWH